MFSIVMATFNGLPYVVEQVESFAAQTLPASELIVTDDGSTDATVATIEAMRDSLPFALRIKRNPRNLGLADNFLSGCALATQDYICFSDQDDVWLPNKLEVLAGLIAAHPTVSLFVHQSEVVDENLNGTGANFPRIPADQLLPPLSGNILRIRPPGFVICFRRALLERHGWTNRPADPEFSGRASYHDAWVANLANAEGGTCYTSRVLALYRRHRNNTTHFRPGGNLGRRFRQIMSLVGTPPPIDLLATQERYAREYAGFFSRLASEPSVSRNEAERYGSLAAQFDRVHEFASHRLRHYQSGAASRLGHFTRAMSSGLYFDKSTFARATLGQDLFYLLRMGPPLT